jgi:hypothetical protein
VTEPGRDPVGDRVVDQAQARIERSLLLGDCCPA